MLKYILYAATAYLVYLNFLKDGVSVHMMTENLPTDREFRLVSVFHWIYKERLRNNGFTNNFRIFIDSDIDITSCYASIKHRGVEVARGECFIKYYESKNIYELGISKDIAANIEGDTIIKDPEDNFDIWEIILTINSDRTFYTKYGNANISDSGRPYDQFKNTL